MCQSGHMANQEKARPGAAAAAGTRRFPRCCLGFPPLGSGRRLDVPPVQWLAVCAQCRLSPVRGWWRNGGNLLKWTGTFPPGKEFFGVILLWGGRTELTAPTQHVTLNRTRSFEVIFWHRCGGSKPTMETLGFGLPRKLCGAAAGPRGVGS